METNSNLPFITFEGPDGAGKSSVLEALKPWLNKTLQIKPYFTREPGGTPIAEQIRNIILDVNNTNLVKSSEILLYEAARAQLVQSEIIPRLNKNQLVICDRYIDSTIAYQGGGNHTSIDTINWLNKYATNQLMPSLTLYYDVEPELGLNRINQHRTDKQDRLDQKSIQYHQLVRNEYLKLAKNNPNRIKVIDGRDSLERNIKRSKQLIESKFKKLFK